MNKLFLLTTLLLLSSQSFGESVSKKTDKYALVSANSALETLLEIPDVKTKYDTCQKDEELKKRYENDMAKCIWAQVSLDESLKKQVLDKYNKLSIKEDKNANRAPASEEKTDKESEVALAAKKLNLATNYADDPQVQALTAFYKKRLDEVLTPNATSEKEKQTISSVNHASFINLYESELGKTIVNAFTSYCLETNKECGEPIYAPSSEEIIDRKTCLVPSDETKRKSNREKNLNDLKGSSSLDLGSSDSAKWTHCIKDITTICSKGSNEDSSEDKGYSARRACLIVDYVKSARENLIAVNAQKDFWNSEDTKSKYQVDANFNDPMNGNKNATSDKLTSITAKDITESSKKADEKRMALMDRCLTTKMVDGKEEHELNDAEACKSFMNTNKEENDKALVEFTLRQEAQSALLEEKLASGDATAIETYLKQEGYTKEQITTLLTNKDPEEVKKMITERFHNEKAALIKEMNERVTKKTSQEEGQITEKDVSNLAQIKKELSTRTSDLAQSVQFNNIVSSYLSYTSKENDKVVDSGRNVASLFAEVESIEDKETVKALEKKIDEAQLKKNETSAVLGLDNLNGILLRYFDGQTEKKEKASSK